MVLRYIRSLSKGQKETIRRRLATVYAIVSWNAFAYCLYYMAQTDQKISGLPPGLHQAALSENVEKTKVLTFSGFSLVESINYGKEEIEEARATLKSNLNPTEDINDF